jgi:hypothetical protein
MTDKPWDIKEAFFELLADYIRDNDWVPGVESVDKVIADSTYEDQCSDGCCSRLVEYVEIYYTDIDGNKHIHTFSGTLEELLGI